MSKPLRELADVYYGKSPNEVVSDESVIPIIGTGGVYGRATRAMYQGPAVIVPRKGSLGNPQFIGEPFWPADTTYAVLPKPKVDAKWLYYSLAAFDLTKLNEATGVPSINRDWLYRIKLGSDEFDGQRRIAEILSTVDEEIEQTEALIAKYQQIKAGLMHDLFTRGVTPDGHLRPTRAQTPQLYKESPLGWIPKEWEVKAVNDVLEIERGFAFSSSDYQETGVLNFRVSNVGLSKEELQNTEYLPPRFWEKFPKQQLFGGEIVIVMVGATTGKIGRIPVELCPALLNQNLWNLRPLAGFDREFAWNVMPSIVSRHMRLSQGSARDFLKQSDFGKTKTVYPEPEEQKTITEALESISKRIECEHQTGRKFRQQKHGLMHDLLTGRVRVKVGEPAST